jgi:hypothetical protein
VHGVCHQSGAILPDPAVLAPLGQRDRHQLMLRFNLTNQQVNRLDLDIARTLLATLH